MFSFTLITLEDRDHVSHIRKKSYQLLAYLHADKYSKLIFDE